MKKLFCFFLSLVLLLSATSTTFGVSVSTEEAETDSYAGTLSESTDLLFEFDNRETDQARYKGAAYGGRNYDQETDGYWATAYNGSYTAYSIVNSGGTLRVHVTDATDNGGTYGPWVKITNTYGKMPTTNSPDLYPLNFDPSGVKTVNIRFKLVNCTVPADKIPEIIFEYYYTKNGTQTYANDMKAVYTFRDGEYMTVSIPVSSKLTGADVLKGFGFRFRNIKGGGNGRIYIDYIYIGANASFVMKNHQDKTFLSQNAITVTSGVKRSQVVLKDKTNNTQITGYIATVSPSAKVTFKASYASYYTKGSTPESRKTACLTMPFKRIVATDHAAAYEAATGDTVLMCTNANFFDGDTAHPRGYLVLEGNIVQTYDSFPAPYFAVLKDGSFAIRPYGTPLTDVQEAVSGYQWLVRDGELIATNDDETAAPRTAIGLKKDGTVVWVAIDGRQEPYSSGLTIHELAELMYAAGCVNAINMDGGGSTTMAARYDTTGDLVLQNSPSDAEGARLLPTCLLMVAEPCNHKPTGSYTVYPNGTHSQVCTSCGEMIRVGHIYENGVCVCGDKQHFEGGLFFDFGNTDEDQYRYTDPAYEYRNFDLSSNGTWGRGYWATAYNNSTSDFTIDNKTGTLSLTVTDGHSGTETDNNIVYGPWLKLTSGYGKSPTKTDSRFGALSYAPSNVDYVELRFKLTNCQTVAGTTAAVYFEYYYEKDGVYTGATDMKSTVHYTDGEYVTVTLPASQVLRDADVLRGFGFRFRNIKGNPTGKITLDYIRIVEQSIKEPILDSSVKLNHSLNLASDIAINYVIPKATLNGCETISLEVAIPTYEGNSQIGTQSAALIPVEKGEYFYFTLEGLTAVQMNNNLQAVLRWSKDGQEYYSVTDDYSIATYAYTLLNSGSDTALKTLCADLLRYGAEAQSYRGYRTDALVDANMTATHRSYLSNTATLTFTKTDSKLGDLSNPTITWVGKTLNLASKVGMKFVFNAKNYSGNLANLSMRVTYKDSNGETKTVTLTEMETYNAANSYYSFTFYGLLASELRTVVEVAVYEGETRLSETLRYSAESYAAVNTTGTLAPLCKALFAYSDSAKTFFAK